MPDAGGGTGSELVEVQVRTGAEVLRELGAPRIDILKIDTEGHDYDVLIGFLPVIDQVDFIQMDAAMNPYDRTHVPLWRFEDLPVASGVPPVSHLRSEDGGEARRSSSPATLQSGFQQWSVGVPAQDSGG
ncbi:MAG: FkbM family methyltransferase [Alphaproteobacteria bacterium]